MEQTVPLSITYPPWLRWWAYIVYTAIFLFFIWVIVEIRARQHRAKLAYVEQVNKNLEREILERKKVEKALAHSEQRLNMALDAAQEGIWELNPQTEEVYFSPTWFTMLGYTVDEFSHTFESWVQRIHPEDQTQVLTQLQKYLAKEDEQYSVEFRMKNKDGAWRWIHSTGSLLGPTDKDGPVKMLGIHLDISERKASEKETRRLETALQHASKMEAIGTLAGGVAHDFNNILSAIIGNCELGLLEVKKTSPLHTKLNQILQAGFRAKDLVLQILTFSRKDKRELQEVYVAPIIEEALSLLRSTIPTSISIEQEMCENRTTILADPTQIHQVIVNLCTNASHAMEEKGGVLRVSLNEIPLTAKNVKRYEGLAPGLYNEIKIEDTGEGISPLDIGNIFNPYFSTKKQGKGSGLGLSVVLGIIHNCGGVIDVESTPGKGSTFTALLPCSIDSSPSATPTIESSLPTKARSCKILVVDDEPILVDILSQQLQQVGHKVISFIDANEALTAYQSAPESYDIIITDMAMPELTGVQFAQQIKDYRSDIPIILCTGYSKKVFSSTPKELGVDAVLQKPIQRLELLREIDHLLDS